MTATLDHPSTTTTTSAPIRPQARGPLGNRAPRPLAYGSPRKGASKIHIVTPQLQLSSKPAALVLRTARLSGPVFRDDAAEHTGLSISTVNRQVGALLKAGLIRERADLAPAGAIGRPRLPFELNVADFLTIGIHIGYKVTSITTHDLLHRVVGAIQIPTPVADTPEQTLAAIGVSARRFVGRWAGRRVLWAGVALGGRVTAGGHVDHPRLGWTAAPVGRIIAETVGLPVSVASHVEAMAAAELVVNPEQKKSSFLYFYAREMVGTAFCVDGMVHTPTSGPPVIGHFPTGPTTLLDPENTGRLEPTASDTGVVEAALALGLPVADIEGVHDLARGGDATARALLEERAEVLGRTVALIADIFNPDHIVLGGQAFTDFPATLPTVAKAVKTTSVVPNRDVRVSHSGTTVQQQAAGAVSLDAIYTDPLEALAVTA
ncbi:ROK family transcriptional regulator [Gordonia insulae]|uniref:Transcriptional regulator n=1 Tax=Gordonia insulae TaxID=2420509 RepID=A0A3G8JMS9_9ACTN|nr:ROK family transcriptional regulator [Gordonia insulae]AZG46396.1 Transcriptional regulator [Gordonia insulae]